MASRPHSPSSLCLVDWEERSRDAAELAARVGEPGVDQRLLALLLDSEDTAVTVAGAELLLLRRDMPGLRLYARAFSLAGENTRDHLGDCLYNEAGTLWADVRRLLSTLATDDDREVREGAAVLVRHMTEQENHHQ